MKNYKQFNKWSAETKKKQKKKKKKKRTNIRNILSKVLLAQLKMFSDWVSTIPSVLENVEAQIQHLISSDMGQYRSGGSESE